MKGLFLLFGAALLVLAQTSWGQRSANWRAHKMMDGLPDSGCVSIAIGANGKILVRHLKAAAISELDGYSITVIPSPGAGNGRIYESPGGQLWSVAPEGLRVFKDGAWLLQPVPELAALLATRVARAIQPVPIRPVRQGHVVFLLPDRLMEYNAENPEQPRTETLRSATQTRLEKFSGMNLARDGGLWIAGARGLAKVPGPVRNLRPQTEWREFILPESLRLQNLQEPQEDEEGGVTLVGESSESQQKMIVRFDGQHWTAQGVGAEKIRYAWRCADRTLWAMTIDSLFQMEPGQPELVQNEEISARQFFDFALEPGGTFWLATSDGLFHYLPRAWRSPVPVRHIGSPVRCLAEDAQGQLWFIAGSGLHRLQNDFHEEFPVAGTTPRTLQSARGLFALKNGKMVLETGEQLFVIEPGRNGFNLIQPEDGPRQFHALGLSKDGALCVQSFNPAAEPDARLEVYDGTRLQPFPAAAPEELAALGKLATLYAGQNGDLWLSGDSGIAWYHEKKWRTFTSTDKSTPEAAVCFAELADGKIWCATPDKIWEFDGRNWSAVRAGFDRINALLRARDGSVWVASNNGLHRFFQNGWIENGSEEGLPSAAVRDIYEDRRGRLWAATTRGLSLFHPEADPDPPQTLLPELSDKEKSIPEGRAITLLFTGQDKWKYTARDRLLYSDRLDDRDWSPFQAANAVSFTELAAGKHYFQVRAMDRNGNVDAKPAQLEFAVVVPWYKERRLVLISFAGLAVALFFAGLAFNRHRQLLQSYAAVEKKVAERTHELELASRELLHSQKMNALGALAAGIAHDFNNILSIIKGSAQIIEDNLDQPEKVRTRLDRIKTVVEQGSGIVKAMLGFSRSSEQQPTRCDLNSVVDDTIKLLGDRFLREVAITLACTPNLPEVSASRDFIQQILLNFIFNAAEAMSAPDSRKRIVLATQALEKLPADIVLMPGQALAYVAISVRDFGSGISPENRPRIFEPFFTTKALSTRRGTGLGLSMVYELAKKMEAGLAVESIVNEGSTFTLILPVRAVPLDLQTESHATQSSSS